MDYLASMYIDNEMDLVEKRQFVEKIKSDASFYHQTLALLAQEQQLRDLSIAVEPIAQQPWQPPMWSVLARLVKPLGFATAGFTAALLLLFSAFQTPAPVAPMASNRFVLFEPAATKVELAGSFTGWQRMSMQRIGNSGYWELSLQLPSGEHRFAYILDGDRRIADPTLPASEMDDFGGQNSILYVEERL